MSPVQENRYISLDVVFDENLTSLLSMPDLSFQGALKMRGNFTHIFNTDTLTKVIGPSIGENEKVPEELIIISPPLEIQFYWYEKKPSDLFYSEYLHIAHGINAVNKSEDKIKDCGINLSDFLPKPRSLSQILRMSTSTKEKWEEATKSELVGLFDSDTF